MSLIKISNPDGGPLTMGQRQQLADIINEHLRRSDMTITITMEPADEFQDPDHGLGLTEEGFSGIMDALSEFGWNIEIRRDSDDD